MVDNVSAYWAFFTVALTAWVACTAYMTRASHVTVLFKWYALLGVVLLSMGMALPLSTIADELRTVTASLILLNIWPLALFILRGVIVHGHFQAESTCLSIAVNLFVYCICLMTALVFTGMRERPPQAPAATISGHHCTCHTLTIQLPSIALPA